MAPRPRSPIIFLGTRFILGRVIAALDLFGVKGMLSLSPPALGDSYWATLQPLRRSSADIILLGRALIFIFGSQRARFVPPRSG